MPHRPGFGIYAALTTPFETDGGIDLGRLSRHAVDCMGNGCAGVSLFGTTGEGPSVGFGERRAALAAVRQAGIAGDRLVLGITVSALDDAIANASLAGEFGCGAVLVTPPHYYKGVSQAAVIEWYSGLLAAMSPDGPRIILYNIPQVTEVPVSREAVATLKARFPALVTGVKDSSGDRDNAEALLEEFPDLAILVGDERLLGRAAQRGAAGSISGIANIRPDLLNALMAGSSVGGAVDALVEAVLRYPVTPAVKALVAHVTGDAAWRRVRPPLTELSAADAVCLGRTYGALVDGLVA